MNATFVLRGESMLPLTTAWLGASVPLYAAIVALNDGETPAPLQSCAGVRQRAVLPGGASRCASGDTERIGLGAIRQHGGRRARVGAHAHAATAHAAADRGAAESRARTGIPHFALRTHHCNCKSDVVESALESSVSADAVRRCLTRLFASPKLVRFGAPIASRLYDEIAEECCCV
jgi:hypothetical protein